MDIDKQIQEYKTELRLLENWFYINREKGKSYQIYVKLLRVLQDSSSRYDYAVPPFRFYAEDSGVQSGVYLH